MAQALIEGPNQGQLRYFLRREINIFGVGTALFVMLNPSTATDEVDDATIRRCINFAKREGCRNLEVCNLSPLRFTERKKLKQFGREPDGVWHENVSTIKYAAQGARMVIAAWGFDGTLENRAGRLLKALPDVEWLCLGMTKEGQPRHPLYLKADAPLIPYKPEG